MRVINSEPLVIEYPDYPAITVNETLSTPSLIESLGQDCFTKVASAFSKADYYRLAGCSTEWNAWVWQRSGGIQKISFAHTMTAQNMRDFTNRLRSSVIEVNFRNNPLYLKTFEYHYSGTSSEPRYEKQRKALAELSPEAMREYVPFTDEILAAWNPHATPSLVLLNLPMGAGDQGVEILAKHQRHWKSFRALSLLGDQHVDSLYRYHAYAIKPSAWRHFVGLRELALENVLDVGPLIVQISASLVNLEKLMICEGNSTRYGSSIQPATFSPLSKLQHLTHLVISPNSAIYGMHADGLSELSHLQLLKLFNCATYKSVRGFLGLSQLTNLTALNLTYCEHVRDEDLTSWSQSLCLLRVLDLSYCCDITDVGLSMLSNLKSLRLIVMKGESYSFSTGCSWEFRHITPASINFLLKENPKLHFILDNLEKVKKETVLYDMKRVSQMHT